MASDLMRLHKLKCSLPPIGEKQHCAKSEATYNPKSVSLQQRVREFPNESLCVSAGRLYRNACQEKIAIKATVIQLHLKSAKHLSGRQQLQQNEVQEQDIT